MPAATKNRNRKYEAVEKQLLAQKEQLSARINGRMEEVYIDREPDDEAALATDSVTKDMAAATLERERRTLQEIDAALERIKTGEYGVCASCAEPEYAGSGGEVPVDRCPRQSFQVGGKDARREL